MFQNFISRRSATAALVLNYLQIAYAIQFFSNATVPANLTVTCSNALLANITACNKVVASLRPGDYYAELILESTCTSECANSLSQYKSSIMSACSGQNWNGYEDTEMPLAIIPDMLLYAFNLTCLMDSGRYCNVVAAQYAYTLDPASGYPANTSNMASFADNSTAASSANSTDPCDLCLIKNLQFEAASPYFDGPILVDQSIYQSKTSSCGVTGYPLTIVDQNIYTPTATTTAPASPTCTGKSYTIQPNDNCNSIAKSQGISTSWLLTDNNLPAFCSQFPTNGTLCLINTCNVYTAQTNDTCDSIASANNITAAQFKAWNPVINAGCYNFNSMIGMEFCIGAPGKPYVAPTVTAIVSSTASTAAPVPTNVAAGTNTHCGEYYQAATGDFCNKILIKFGISLSDFVFLNPAINSNCTNLNSGIRYCVEAVGDINTYSGHNGHSTPGPTATATGTPTPFSALANATYTMPTPTSTPAPLADGTRTDCNAYFLGDVFENQNLSRTNWNSHCDLAAAVYGVDLTAFGLWNPSLGNTSLSNCTFSSGLQYCGKLYFGEPAASVIPTSTLPIRNGTTTNCTKYADVTTGWTCQNVLDTYDLTISQFYAYNTAVNPDCSGLWPSNSPNFFHPTFSSLNQMVIHRSAVN